MSKKDEIQVKKHIIKKTSEIILYYEKKQISLRNAMKFHQNVEIVERNYSLVHSLVFETVRFQNIHNRLIHLNIQQKIDFRLPSNALALLKVLTYLMTTEPYKTQDQWISACYQVLENDIEENVRPYTKNFIANIQKWSINDLTDTISDYEERLGVQYAHPTWLVRDFIKFYGLETTIKILKANNRALPVYIRLNLINANKKQVIEVLSSEKVEVEEDPDLADLLKVVSWEIPLPRLPSFTKGIYYVQNKGSALVSHIINPQPGEAIFDACAAPGGKTTHIASLQHDRGSILAIDNHIRRISEMREKINLFNIKSVNIMLFDLRVVPNFRKKFDKILVDAPCSGSGTFSSRPDSKWRVDRHQTKWLSNLQFTLLSNASTLLKEDPNAYIVYVTCSLHPLENEYVIEHFLETHQDLELKPQNIFIGTPSPKYHLAQRLFPFLNNTEGFSIFKLGWKN
ncbi:MAG: RsmB/NOP family class I SAM-dependent RNA methyltransferase [Candidatus Hodarchaeales archaeon]